MTRCAAAISVDPTSNASPRRFGSVSCPKVSFCRLITMSPNVHAAGDSAHTINARAETVEDRAMWHGPFEQRRCLVIAEKRGLTP